MYEFLWLLGTGILIFVLPLHFSHKREKRLDKLATELFDEECRLTAMAALLGENIEFVGRAQKHTMCMAAGDDLTVVSRDGKTTFTITSSNATTLTVEC